MLYLMNQTHVSCGLYSSNSNHIITKHFWKMQSPSNMVVHIYQPRHTCKFYTSIYTGIAILQNGRDSLT